MYLQEVVISPDIFEKVYNVCANNSNEFIDVRSYLENLKLKKVSFENSPEDDSVISSEYFKFRDNSEGEQKRVIKAILDIILVSQRFSVRQIDSKSAYCKDRIWNTLLSLSLQSESKIINAENKSHKALALKHKELSDIEILNFEEFIKPPNQSRLFCLEKELQFERHSTIRFEEYFVPYLTDAKRLIVSDRYFRKRNGGYVNFVKLIKLIDKLESVEIRTYNDKKLDEVERNAKNGDYVKLDELEQALVELHPGIKVKYGNNEHARYLETDRFRIDLDPGLDFVNHEYKALYNNVKIRFRKLA